MPTELESLYADMWTRLNANNSVYRESAGKYFRYVILGSGYIMVTKGIGSRHGHVVIGNPNLMEVAMADRLEGVDSRDILPARFVGEDASPAKLKQMYEVAQKNIRTRCAGLLQIRPAGLRYILRGIKDFDDLEFYSQQVTFIHRTAHDFLIDTEAGQRILNFKHDAALSTDTGIRLFRGSLCMANMLFERFGLMTSIVEPIEFGRAGS